MYNQDTINLLKECNAGIKMGVNAIDQVLDKVKDEKFKVVIQSNNGKAGQAISVYKQNAEEYEDGHL